MKKLNFIIVCILCMKNASGAYSNPEVTLAHGGLVSGMSMQSLDDRDFFAFRGIPYAKPPLGKLRFKAPEPVEPWEGVRDATEESDPCAQVPLMGGETFVGSEDCLYLNVYTPKLPTSDEKEHLPVIFWIHGGAFYAGDGGIEENGPEFLMDQDVVLVTINYRLGAFGFLSSGDQKIPGNFGMKDQVMALKWVQDNIQNFGGDKDKVVIWGYSAGSACVQAHLFSPMSTGLFSGAIYQSGSLHSQCGFRSKPSAVLQVLGSVTDCNQIEVLDQLECLRKLPASTLAGAINSFPFWGMKIPAVFSVVQEFADFKDGTWLETPFLTEDPNKLLVDGVIVNDVPTITGLAQDEGNTIGYSLRENPHLYKQADKNFADVARLGCCLYGMKPKKFEKIRKFYFEDKTIGQTQFENFIKFYGDAFFNWGQVNTAMKQAKAGKSKVYFYLFTFEGRISEAMAFGMTPIKGVGHADDLAYIFRRKVPFPGGPNKRERDTIKRMGSILENFAKTGNPTPELNELFETHWEPLAGDNFKYLEINEDLQMNEGFPFPDRMKFWQQLNKKKKSKPAKEEL